MKQRISALAMLLSAFILIFITEATLVPKSSSVELMDVFDTYSEIRVYSNKNTTELLGECEKYLRELDDKWSFTKTNSEIYKLNHQMRPKLSSETFDIISTSLEYSRKTYGMFDITTGGLCEIWGFNDTPTLPSHTKIIRALNSTGHSLVNINKELGTVSFKESQTKITLGGIAKGYATQGIVDILEKNGVNSALINLGGNVHVIGMQKNSTPWEVGILDPIDTSNIIGSLSVSDMSVVTSGGYIRNFEEHGVIYHHLLNPFTGYPADNGLLSVTIVSPDPTMADVLSTACFVAGYEHGVELVEEFNVSAIFVTDKNEVYISPQLESIFKKSTDNYSFKLIS